MLADGRGISRHWQMGGVSALTFPCVLHYVSNIHKLCVRACGSSRGDLELDWG